MSDEWFEVKHLAGRMRLNRIECVGWLCHAVPKDQGERGRALCGIRPMGNSLGWSEHKGLEALKCERCATRLRSAKSNRIRESFERLYLSPRPLKPLSFKKQANRKQYDPQIYEMYLAGALYKEIAYHFGISLSTVCNAIGRFRESG